MKLNTFLMHDCSLSTTTSLQPTKVPNKPDYPDPGQVSTLRSPRQSLRSRLSLLFLDTFQLTKIYIYIYLFHTNLQLHILLHFSIIATQIQFEHFDSLSPVIKMFHFFMQIPKSLLHQLLIFLLLISLSNFPGANSQPPNPNTSNNTNGDLNQYPYANFNPSIAIIIVVLVAALFFMGFFSIYIRHCADDTSGGSVRNLLSMHTRRANAPRGIEESVLETFPTFSYAEVKDHKFGKGALECAVCLNEFEDTETLRLIPRCDHVFHAECIDAWLQGHVTCPVCRADLTPKTGEEEQSDQLPESTIPEIPDNQTVRNDDVTVQIDTQERSEVKPQVNRNLSFGNVNRPTRNDSMKGGAARRNIVGGFRSHSTGHSLVQPGENLDRFTLRLPHEMRKEMMNRALLNRTKSFAPRNGSTRGYGDGSSRGGRSFRRIEQSDRNARSDRWGLSRAVPFFSRASSLRSPKVVAENSEGSTSRSIKNTVRMPSFKCLEPRSADETGLIQANTDRPPV